jgi:hypothetical protein
LLPQGFEVLPDGHRLPQGFKYRSAAARVLPYGQRLPQGFEVLPDGQLLPQGFKYRSAIKGWQCRKVTLKTFSPSSSGSRKVYVGQRDGSNRTRHTKTWIKRSWQRFLTE